MRFYLTVLLLVVNCLVWGQFSDDFEDGDFTNSPTWSGQDANFIVNGSNELQLNAPAVTDTSYLAIPATDVDDVTWDFYVRMEFNPSSSNLTRVYLMSDNANLKGSLNGYFVQIGNTSDEISLYRQDGLTTTEILDGLDDAVDLSAAIARIQVTRDAAGNWEVLRDTLGGYNFVTEGTVNDNTHTTATHFGFFCKYTSTRSTSFFFDNVGNPYVDATNPTLISAVIDTQNDIIVQFSEPMEQITAETLSNYSVDGGIGQPTSALLGTTDASMLDLGFAGSFVNGQTYTLTVNNVEDLAGNPIASPSTTQFTYFVPEIPAANDVIITEFICDPSPAVGLPEVEYVELYNRSSKVFDLSNWTISDASSTATLPFYVLSPGEYVLITNNGEGAQFFVSNFIEVSLPSLNNSDDAIVLKDDANNTLDSIFYTNAWYQNPAKEDGGWAIERKHLDAPCNDMSNWSAAINTIGGTPAEQNSNWTDQDDVTPPFVSSFEVISNSELLLEFNELLDTTVAADLTIDPTVTTLDWQYATENSLSVFPSVMQTSIIYDISVSLAQDCWGNAMNNQPISLGLPDSVVQGDIILNEIMFNPLTNGSDYVEIYNKSDKILDLQDLYLANWSDSIANIKPISSEQFLINPGTYILVTEDTNDIKNDFSIYGIGTLFESDDIPTYNNDSGTVYLLSKDQIVLDYFNYDEDFHFSLLNSNDGKSLERISFDAETNDPSNWHTAAETVEWGTPGYENSQLYTANPSGTVTVKPQMFSPDSDGYNDVVTITLQLESTENVIDIEIFDNQGRLVRRLEDNFFAGSNSTFTWDGINEDGEKALIGTYVVLISVVDDQDLRLQFKEVIVLAGQL
ncbi:MAG: lamin tail domain-containing protein [Crocinitomicaceae bacterium]